MADTSAKATWVRVRLAGERGLTEGDLVLRADRVAVDDEHLLFMLGEDVVFRLDRRYFRALTWFVDRPTFGEWLKARRAQFPHSHTRWTEVETERLLAEVAHSWDWARIAEGHGRTVNAVKARSKAATDGR